MASAVHYSNCELDTVTGTVTCDAKCAKMRKYRPREELGLSLLKCETKKWPFQAKIFRFQMIYIYFSICNSNFGILHQQKVRKLTCGYIAMYSDKINSNLEIQVFKYMRIHRTSKMHSTTRKVYSAILAMVYKVLHEMQRIQEHVLSLYKLS